MASFSYWILNHFFPAKETLLSESIYEDVVVIDGVTYTNDGVHDPKSLETVEVGVDEKHQTKEGIDVV
jgi:hypothetical protein